MKISALFIASILGFYACGQAPESAGTGNASNTSAARPADGAAAPASQADPAATPKPKPADGEPKTVRDFFTLLPQKYFTLEGCDTETDKDCSKARAQYLKDMTVVEDIPNGYFKGGCDGAQACIEMAIFKRPDGRYVIGVQTVLYGVYTCNFLDYSDGKWTDVSKKVVPGFSQDLIYDMPRNGTTVKVFAKSEIDSDKDRKLYELAWKDGRFTKK